MTKKVCITFDLDDTLIPTQELLYDKTNKQLSIYISQLLSAIDVNKEMVLKTFDRIDYNNLIRYGYSRKRYPLSWVQTLAFFVGDDYPELDKQKQIVQRLANAIFTQRLSPYPEVITLLQNIRNECDLLHVLTAGEVALQEKRVDDAGIRDYFDQVFVVPAKNPSVMGTYISHFPEYQHVMIGNSLRSDIYPALSCGMLAIHIEKGSWHYDAYDIDTNNQNYVKTNLPLVLDIIKKWRNH